MDDPRYVHAVKDKIDFNLTTNFSLSELVRTSKKVDNWPKNTEVIWHLHNLCWYVLQPIRNHYGRSVKVSSGYRSKELNTLIGGSLTSQHSFGMAADFEIPGVDNREVAKWIYANISYDQLILEFYQSKSGKSSGWIHCSYKPTGRRNEFLIARKSQGRTLYLPATISSLDKL